MDKREKQATAWIIVFLILTILPIFTYIYFGFFVVIISPFALVIAIKMINNLTNDRYKENSGFNSENPAKQSNKPEVF